MRSFGCVLGLELAVPWGHEISPKERASILGIAERDGNVWGRSCVELDTLDTEARHEETAILGHTARGSSGRAPSFRTFGAGFRASAYRADCAPTWHTSSAGSCPNKNRDARVAGEHSRDGKRRQRAHGPFAGCEGFSGHGQRSSAANNPLRPGRRSAFRGVSGGNEFKNCAVAAADSEVGNCAGGNGDGPGWRSGSCGI